MASTSGDPRWTVPADQTPLSPADSDPPQSQRVPCDVQVRGKMQVLRGRAQGWVKHPLALSPSSSHALQRGCGCGDQACWAGWHRDRGASVPFPRGPALSTRCEPPLKLDSPKRKAAVGVPRRFLAAETVVCRDQVQRDRDPACRSASSRDHDHDHDPVLLCRCECQ